jgi:uncharacterized protein (DUF2126 family)
VSTTQAVRAGPAVRGTRFNVTAPGREFMANKPGDRGTMVGGVRFRADDPTSAGHDSALDLTSRVLSATQAGQKDPAPKMSLVVPP